MTKPDAFATRRIFSKLFPGICAVVASLIVSGCDKSPEAPPRPVPVTNRVLVTNATPKEAAPLLAVVDLQKLVGRWLRPDGGYVLEIKSVAPDGKLTATYLNPRAINVSQAEARKDAGAVKVFVELRDQNYPGCTYTLTYDPEHDVLAGVYFQAALGEKFDVGFERIKPGQP